ncbi:MAG: SulP family inorganic anion transporter [Syntrophobacteraceae bacterium]|jgi:SulP family sulfate permease
MKRPSLERIFPFLQWWPSVNRRTLQADLMAGVTNAIVVLPQGIAFALIAGMPAEYGLYAAIVPAVIAALFGSSFHLISGPVTAISIVIFSRVSTLAVPFTSQYIKLALTMTLIAGAFQLLLGLARLGALVNFVSLSVLVGFTSGAALLIGISQLGNVMGVPAVQGSSVLDIGTDLVRLLPQTNPYAILVALVTLVAAALLRRLRPRWPGLAIAMTLGGILAVLIEGRPHHLHFVGALPASLPPFSLPDLSIGALRKLVPGAMAVAMLGLAQAISSARSIATLSHQRIDNNQEFIGQGLSNVVGSFFSSFAASGSFTRTGVNYDAGAKTPMAAVFAALSLLVMLFVIAPLTAYLPVASMGGVLLLVCYNLINLRQIRAIWAASRSESAVVIVTFLSTLLLDLEFAIFLGVMLSLLLYLNRTSHPQFTTVIPRYTGDLSTFVDACEPQICECPQLKIIRLDGSIFFGAANHISEMLQNIVKRNPEQCHILIVGSGINFVDVSGCAMLFEESRSMHLEGRQLYLCSLKDSVLKTLERGKCLRRFGQEYIFASKREALEKIVPQLDPERCRMCHLRLFKECELAPSPETLNKYPPCCVLEENVE